jgi:hypothetical protein
MYCNQTSSQPTYLDNPRAKRGETTVRATLYHQRHRAERVPSLVNSQSHHNQVMKAKDKQQSNLTPTRGKRAQSHLSKNLCPSECLALPCPAPAPALPKSPVPSSILSTTLAGLGICITHCPHISPGLATPPPTPRAPPPPNSLAGRSKAFSGLMGVKGQTIVERNKF